MSKTLKDIEVPIDERASTEALEEKLNLLSPDWVDYRILRQSVDARRRHAVHFVYSVEVAGPNEVLSNPKFDLEKVSKKLTERPIVIGTGPAGLFAALRFVERGIPCILLERGSQAETRIKGINRFWRYGELDTRNNVCFGEGGAGLYSDGKLITRIKSPHIPYVLSRLVQFGAPEEIQYLNNPHVGSDKIRRVIPHIREFLKANGCEIHFDTRVTKILNNNKKITGVETEHGTTFNSPFVILATGHSANDIFDHLKSEEVFMEGKSFAVGLRIEHPQSLINKIQYRDFAENPKLGSANYKLTHHYADTNIGVYSFCMCPGGYVLSSGTEADGIVCNGMSNYHRNGKFANAAIVVTVDFEKNFKKTFDGLSFREGLEKKAYQAVRKNGGTKELPAQRLNDFLNNKTSVGLLAGSSPSGTCNVNFNELLPAFISENLRNGFEQFEKKMKGYLSNDATLYGVESRTSCPIRITRNEESLESLSHVGLYPCGEGAGYAGGITSAACDGVRVADKIFDSIK